MSVEGKRVIVTGGASGIGAAAVHAFAAAGAAVAAVDLSEDGAAVARCASDAGPGRAHFFRASVADRAALTAAVDEAVATLGGIDGLIHAAGVQQYKPAEELTDADWDHVVGTNARGTMIANQAVFGYMKAAGGGRIVNFASAAGIAGLRGCAHYSASKGAVLSWTRVIAQEWAQHGITANAVAPAMWTEMYQRTRDRLSPEQLAEHDAGMARALPLGGRLGDPTYDMAPVLLFLMSDGARFINGQTIPVDGGMVMVR
ncbi:SDR family NAD(P)-dependent oxidoreductase [Sphingobium naphthae]|jgi:NAD(P)-dependent dehydrogenase (short-subunit alcohol dehydrogenase family)|uniref:SDR family NAD(P)-dependent oxidoreductase n=1 Tax=Sphingobium naphthae TaxID=1886786 RepID=A0ABU4A139_9SPHN|nr:SDR family NAD(P)-dependent oxidoreductase [Sphingobium naphthae]MCC4250853.1 SDR family oxidoreductase [Sphingobium naphthae]MDV5825495.1 SDR family NAD(P)-dependent oxidoreductase [Sphingobium naphthae]